MNIPKPSHLLSEFLFVTLEFQIYYVILCLFFQGHCIRKWKQYENTSLSPQTLSFSPINKYCLGKFWFLNEKVVYTYNILQNTRSSIASQKLRDRCSTSCSFLATVLEYRDIFLYLIYFFLRKRQIRLLKEFLPFFFWLSKWRLLHSEARDYFSSFPHVKTTCKQRPIMRNR